MFELKEKAGKEDWVVKVDEETPVYSAELSEKYTDQITEAFAIKDKTERTAAIGVIKQDIVSSYPDADDIQLGKVLGAFKTLEKDIVRKNILSNQPRIDGRDADTVTCLLLFSNSQLAAVERIERCFNRGAGFAGGGGGDGVAFIPRGLNGNF